MAVNGDKTSSSDEFWLFGYGSLIWKPPPHFGMHCNSLLAPEKELDAYIITYLIQTGEYLAGSMDTSDGFGKPPRHARSPRARRHPDRALVLGQPGGRARLRPRQGVGAAYRIEADHVAEVKDYLDIREINGYSIHYTPFHPASGESGPIRTLVYIGTPDNDQFTGPQDPQALAEHIHASEGPSGLNHNYLLSLEKALDELGPESGDAHITDLSDRVREIAARDAKGETHAQLPEEPASHEFRKVSSIDEQGRPRKPSAVDSFANYPNKIPSPGVGHGSKSKYRISHESSNIGIYKTATEIAQTIPPRLFGNITSSAATRILPHKPNSPP
ncbi:hypothetical protein PG988_008727 [Apiospora saccharicola]